MSNFKTKTKMTLKEVVLYWKGAHRQMGQTFPDEVVRDWIGKMETKLREGGVPPNEMNSALVEVFKLQADRLLAAIGGDTDVIDKLEFCKIDEV